MTKATSCKAKCILFRDLTVSKCDPKSMSCIVGADALMAQCILECDKKFAECLKENPEAAAEATPEQETVNAAQ